MRGRVVLMSLAALLFGAPAIAAEPYGLVPDHVCLAGSWGEPSPPRWRVQLGVYHSQAGLRRAVAALAAAAVDASSFAAVWLGPGWPPSVLVSAPYPSERAARAAAMSLRRRGIEAFARWFTVYHLEPLPAPAPPAP